MFMDSFATFLPPQHETVALQVLNDEQSAALRNVISTVRPKHEAALKTIKQTVEAVGFGAYEMQALLMYIRDR